MRSLAPDRVLPSSAFLPGAMAAADSIFRRDSEALLASSGCYSSRADSKRCACDEFDTQSFRPADYAALDATGPGSTASSCCDSHGLVGWLMMMALRWRRGFVAHRSPHQRDHARRDDRMVPVLR